MLILQTHDTRCVVLRCRSLPKRKHCGWLDSFLFVRCNARITNATHMKVSLGSFSVCKIYPNTFEKKSTKMYKLYNCYDAWPVFSTALDFISIMDIYSTYTDMYTVCGFWHYVFVSMFLMPLIYLKSYNTGTVIYIFFILLRLATLSAKVCFFCVWGVRS